MWFKGTHFVNSIYRHLFPWILLGLMQVFILPYGKSKEMTERLQGWTQVVFFKEMSFAAFSSEVYNVSLGPICKYTARWRKFYGEQSFLSKETMQWQGLDPHLSKSLHKLRKKWPRTTKMWELLAQKTSWNSTFFFEPCNCQETKCFMHTCCGSISFLLQILVSISLFYNN